MLRQMMTFFAGSGYCFDRLLTYSFNFSDFRSVEIHTLTELRSAMFPPS